MRYCVHLDRHKVKGTPVKGFIPIAVTIKHIAVLHSMSNSEDVLVSLTTFVLTVKHYFSLNLNVAIFLCIKFTKF